MMLKSHFTLTLSGKLQHLKKELKLFVMLLGQVMYQTIEKIVF